MASKRKCRTINFARVGRTGNYTVDLKIVVFADFGIL